MCKVEESTQYRCVVQKIGAKILRLPLVAQDDSNFRGNMMVRHAAAFGTKGPLSNTAAP